MYLDKWVTHHRQGRVHGKSSALRGTWGATWAHWQAMPPLLFPTWDWSICTEGHLRWVPAPQKAAVAAVRVCKRAAWASTTSSFFVALGASFDLMPWLFFFTWCILGTRVSNFPHCQLLLLLPLADLTSWLDLRPVLLLQVFPTASVLWVAPITAMRLALLKALRTVLFASEPIWPSSSAPGLSSVQEQFSSGCDLPPSQQGMCMNSNIYRPYWIGGTPTASKLPGKCQRFSSLIQLQCWRSVFWVSGCK